MFLATSVGRILAPGTSGGGGTVTNSLSISAPGALEFGDDLLVIGFVSPANDAVEIALSTSGTTAPSEWGDSATTNNVFVGVLSPGTIGTFYAWANDPATTLTAVSGSIVVSGTLNLPGGLTPDELPAGAAIGASDIFLMAQGGKQVVTQTAEAMAAFMAAQFESYIADPVTVTTSIELDASVHNKRLLIVETPGITIAPLLSSLTEGFECTAINASGGTFVLSGMVTNTGGTIVANHGRATIDAYGVTPTINAAIA
jgi:hypothetical protein